jgi:hypothetical protein
MNFMARLIPGSLMAEAPKKAPTLDREVPTDPDGPVTAITRQRRMWMLEFT